MRKPKHITATELRRLADEGAEAQAKACIEKLEAYRAAKRAYERRLGKVVWKCAQRVYLGT